MHGIVCDLDGTVYRGEQTIPGAVKAIERLRARGARFVFCTNHSRLTVPAYAAKLRELGLPVTDEEIVTSAVATAAELDRTDARGRRALVVGQEGVRDALAGVGIEVVERDDPREVDLVVVGWDDRFDYDLLRRAADAIRAGAEFIATNDDATFPRKGGLWPGAGALCAAVATAAGRAAHVVGKPHPPMLEEARRRLPSAVPITMVGDSIETDIAGAQALDWKTVLVLTGVTTRETATRLVPPPDLVLETIAQLPERLNDLLGSEA